jgi:hypothetical protein
MRLGSGNAPPYVRSVTDAIAWAESVGALGKPNLMNLSNLSPPEAERRSSVARIVADDPGRIDADLLRFVAIRPARTVTFVTFAPSAGLSGS